MGMEVKWNESRGAPSNDQLDNKTSNNKTRHVYTDGDKTWTIPIRSRILYPYRTSSAINYPLYMDMDGIYNAMFGPVGFRVKDRHFDVKIRSK